MDYQSARLHNLILRIYKAVSQDNAPINIAQELSKEDLKNLYFRESDFLIINNANLYFSKRGECYVLTDKAKSLISEYIKLHNEYKSEDCGKDEFIRIHEEIQEYIEETSLSDLDEFNRKVSQLVPLAPPLHWKYQPEYEEYLLVNSGQIPEKNPKKFYDHYHMLEDLYWYITDNPKKKRIDSFLGDMNLNIKFEFKVYSRRWGHYDLYQVSRTVEGWNVDFLMTGGKGDKKGSAILYCLKHDSINYPCHVEDLFEDIWNFADSQEIDVERLASLMNQVAEWISITERETPELDFGGE